MGKFDYMQKPATIEDRCRLSTARGGLVRLLKKNTELGAMLLEHLKPGTLLTSLIKKNLESDARVTAVSVHNKSLLHRVVAHTVKKRIDRSVSKSLEEEANGEWASILLQLVLVRT
ncbi:MAG: hypothetical protein QF815_01890 [Candidatus Peribacteraceae bacterium]|jgi:hypothetical protein|nr:hypothetical protein [Candidatus Peribacteraceae bacterium]